MPVFIRLFTFLILTGFFCNPANARQQEINLEDTQIISKFGDITESALRSQPDHGYPFEYLLNEASVRFEERNGGIMAKIDRLVRIKVYSSNQIEIAEAALVGIPYYSDENMERITGLEAVTHLPNGRKVQLDTENRRTVDLNSRYKIIEFEMPDAEQGAVLEYKYTLERRYIEELPDFYFANRVPTKKAQIYLTNKDYLRYETVTQNVDFDIEYIEQRIDTSSIPLVFTYQRPNPVYIQSWKATDVPAVDASSFISSIDDIRGQLKFQISEFGIPRQPLENSWEFVAAQIRRSANPFEIINEHPELEERGKEIAGRFADQIEAQDSIFTWVNRNLQFNGQNAVFAEQPLDRIVNGEPANQAEINMVLLALLRGAGIDARPLYISGRDYGRINNAFPSLYQFNRMLVVSFIGEDKYFLDASIANSLPGLISVSSYNEQGMALLEEDYMWVEITPDKSVFELDIQLNGRLTAEGDLSGSVDAVTRGYPSRQIREDMAGGIPLNEIVSKTFFEVYPEAELSNSSIHINEDDPDSITTVSDFRIPEYATSFTDGLEFRPMVVGYLFQNPFESTMRRVPITLDAPEKLSITYSIEIPDGFVINEANESRSTRLQGAELLENYRLARGRIEYSFEINIIRKEFSTDVYSQLRSIYERWVYISNNNWYIERN
jgi:transglutaminase-like putative cysteine protease